MIVNKVQDDEPKPKLTGTESYKLNKTLRLPQAW